MVSSLASAKRWLTFVRRPSTPVRQAKRILRPGVGARGWRAQQQQHSSRKMSSLERLDIFPKTFDDFKERTLGGALISIVCCLLALCLFTAEFAQYRAVETVDRLDVDTRTAANSKLSINLDVLLPSLPCDEIVMDVVDESGSEQLAVTNTLHKLRVDRHGVPIDTPEAVDWSHTLAPAFHQRKVIQLMDDAHLHLSETLGHLQHEEEENPSLSAEGHEAHREELTTQAALLQGRLAHLTAVAEEAEHAEVVGDAAHQEHMAMTAQEVEALHASITESQAYSDEQREQVPSVVCRAAVSRAHSKQSHRKQRHSKERGLFCTGALQSARHVPQPQPAAEHGTDRREDGGEPEGGAAHPPLDSAGAGYQRSTLALCWPLAATLT